jgi:hypothetical protein
MSEEGSLEDFKKNYREIQGKYGLPSFEELNVFFNIEKAAENETDFILREIRRIIADRLFNYARFVESLLNPVNVPMFVFSVVKILGAKEKEDLTEIYKKLAKREIDLIALDVGSTEEKEAKFIMDSFELWKDIKEDFLRIIEMVKKNWDTDVEEGKKDYFG